jgi:ribosome recycling factor
MNSARITYTQRSDATSEDEVAALRNIYRFIIDCHAKKEATRPSSPDDAKERSENVSSATQNYTR